MKFRHSIFKLGRILDDPTYEGFAMANFPRTFPLKRTTRNWRVIRLASTWSPTEVEGRVRKFNDFPCVNFKPAFSSRAVDVLRDLLEPNGELLPFSTSIGEYFAFNTTTIADILNHSKSTIQWLVEPITAFLVTRYEFDSTRLDKLSIFRIPECPSDEYVTERFVQRVTENKLNGFHFAKVWPYPDGIDWMAVEKKNKKRKAARHQSGGRSVKGETLVLRLYLGDGKSKGTPREKKQIDRFMNEIDAILVDVNSTCSLGSLEGFDYGFPGECRLFLSSPDAKMLCEKALRSWMTNIHWPNGWEVVFRKGNFMDAGAPEQILSAREN
jgi:hypothetical protein